MDFGFSEEQLEMKRMAKDFAEKELKPIVEKDEKEHRFRPELVQKMGELGFYGAVIKEQYGGMDTGHLSSMLMTEEIAAVSPSYGVTFNMQMMGPALTLQTFGNEEQKKKYIPGLVAGTTLGCFAITEPDSGSDVASMKTTATETPDGWILNGNKMWISNAHVAHMGLVFAYTDKALKVKGMSCFLVDMTLPGIHRKSIDTKLGLFSSPTGEITFDQVKIPKDSILGNKGDGFKICMSMLDCTRLSCSCRAVGVARACLEHAIRYSQERKQFDVPICEHQLIQGQLAEMKVHEETARLLVHRAAWLKDQGQRNTLDVSMAKYVAGEAANHAAGLAVKIFGSYGFSSEYPVERLYRDAKSFQIVEGTSNIQQVIIAGYLLGKRK